MQSPLKPCKSIGCHNLTRDKNGYCKEHLYVAKRKEADRQKHYDSNVRHMRDKKYSDFYNSCEWERVREYILTIYNGLDIYAYYIDRKIELANTIHHIIEIKDDWNKRLDIDNLFPLTESNHSKIHMLYKRDKEGTMKLLMGLIERYKKEFNIDGG